VVKEVEQAAVGVLGVLHHQHDGLARGHPLDEDPPAREQFLAGQLGARVFGIRDAEQPGQPGADVRPLVLVGQPLLHALDELGGRQLRPVVLRDAEPLPHHLSQRPERDTLAVGQATAVMPVDVVDQAVDVLAELPAQPRLPDAGRAGDDDHPRGAPLGRGVEQLTDGAHLGVPAGERCFETVDTLRPAHPGDDPGRAPELLRLGLALEGVAVGVLEPDGVGREPLGGRVHQHLAGAGRGLHPGCCVDRVARDHALVDCANRHGDLAGDDARPGGQGVDLALGTELPDRVDQVQSGAHCPLGVALGGGRSAPDRHHGVADELLHHTAVPADHGARRLEVRREQLADFLRVTRLGQWGEAHEVAKEDRAQAAFGDRGRGERLGGDQRGSERCAALTAELEPRLDRLPARGTRLGQGCTAFDAKARALGVGRPARSALLHPRCSALPEPVSRSVTARPRADRRFA
jgi:hypothetical protein